MICAEKKSSKICPHHLTEWSKELQNISKEITSWEKVYKEAKIVGSDNSRNIKDIYKQLEVARQKRRNIIKDPIPVREQNLHDRAKEMREYGDKTNAECVEMLKTREAQKRRAQRIRNAHKPFSGSTINHIIKPACIPDMNDVDTEAKLIWDEIAKTNNGKDITEWKRVTGKSRVEALLNAWNKKHFNQAQSSPLATEDWQNNLDNQEYQNKILDGSQDFHDIPTEIKEWLSHMKYHENIEPNKVKFDVSYESFTKYVKKIKEKTTSSPSGRHYGHYKSLLDTDEFQTLYDILDIAIKYQVILPRWLEVILILMEKDSNNPKIHRFRSIHMIEGDLGYVLKRNWAKKLMAYTEEKNILCEDQYGARKNHQAQSAVINKIISFDLSEQLREPIAHQENDAQNCYDRLILNLVSLATRRYGMSQEANTFMSEVLKKMHYHSRTGYGATEIFYAWSHVMKIWGLGQGMAWAGPGWLFISEIIMKAMQKNSYGIKMTDPTRTITIKRMEIHLSMTQD